MNKLSIVIPVFNEAAEVVSAIDTIRAYYEGKDYFHEIILVNDGSNDTTGLLIKQYAQIHPKIKAFSYPVNRGKGYALNVGIQQATGSHILFFDIDLAVPLTLTEPFIDCFDNPSIDIVIGTRKSKDSVILVHQPWYREFLGKGFRRLTNLMLCTHFSDITCGFKCFKTSVAQRLFSLQRIERWGFDSEILYLAQRCNYHIVELPVTWKDSADSRVSVIRDIMRAIAELITIRLTRYTL